MSHRGGAAPRRSSSSPVAVFKVDVLALVRDPIVKWHTLAIRNTLEDLFIYLCEYAACRDLVAVAWCSTMAAHSFHL